MDAIRRWRILRPLLAGFLTADLVAAVLLALSIGETWVPGTVPGLSSSALWATLNVLTAVMQGASLLSRAMLRATGVVGIAVATLLSWLACAAGAAPIAAVWCGSATGYRVTLALQAVVQAQWMVLMARFLPRAVEEVQR